MGTSRLIDLTEMSVVRNSSGIDEILFCYNSTKQIEQSLICDTSGFGTIICITEDKVLIFIPNVEDDSIPYTIVMVSGKSFLNGIR